MVAQEERWEEGMVRKFGMSVYTLLHLKWITNKDLLYSTWNSAQCYVAVWIGGEFGGEWIHVYVWLSPFAIYLKPSQHCLLIVYTSIQNKMLFFFFKAFCFHSKGSHEQNEKATLRMVENICKWSKWQGTNFQNIQTTHAAQYQKNKTESKNQNLKGCMHCRVHCSTIYNS